MSKKTPLELFEKVVLRKNKYSEDIINLHDLPTKSAEALQKALEDRFTLNEPYTLSGSSLIHIESPSPKLSTLYKYAEQILSTLKSTKKNQIIPIIGSSLKAKELDKSILISYLTSLTAPDITLSSKIQSAHEILQIFGFSRDDSFYGEKIDLGFSQSFELSNCKISAKLLDLDLPLTCGIFRILCSQSDPVLQHLGLSHLQPKEKNIELHRKFKENLQTLAISWSEIQEIMEILAASVLIGELELSTSHYTIAGQGAGNIYMPEVGKKSKRVCRLLGLLDSRFQEFFTGKSKENGKARLASLRKILVVAAFEKLVDRINESLGGRGRSREEYVISLISFPGPKIKSNIEGMISNLFLECLEFVVYQGYFEVLTLLNEEKVALAKLNVPRCRYIIELFIDKSLGVIYNFCSSSYWHSLVTEILGDAVYNKILSISEDLLTLNNSWGSTLYHLPTLQYQFHHFPDISYKNLLKRCSHRVISSFLTRFSAESYEDYINSTLAELVSEISGKQMHIIYCYKDVKEVITETPIVSLLNLPYKCIIPKSLVSVENLKRLGVKMHVSNKFFFVESPDVQAIQKLLGKCRVEDLNSMLFFGFSENKGPRICDYIQTKSRSVSKRCSSAKSKPFFTSISVISSKTSTRNLSGSLHDYRTYSFIDLIPYILKIQAAWRGYQSRAYFKSLKSLNQSAKCIQKLWKGYKIRKSFNLKKILSSIVHIQRLFRRRLIHKNNAAKIIQRYFLSKKSSQLTGTLLSPQNHVTCQISISKPSQRSQSHKQRSQSLQKQPTFTPVLSKKSIKLAALIAARDSLSLKVEDRLMMKGKQRAESIKKVRIEKSKSERVLSVNANAKKKVDGKFYEAQMQFLKSKKEGIEELKEKICREEKEKCPFKPIVGSEKGRRSCMETVNELYVWNKKKVINREKLIARVEYDEMLTMLNPKVLTSSERMHRNKVAENGQKSCMIKQVQKTLSPYWPGK